jgi:hypothetical protein
MVDVEVVARPDLQVPVELELLVKDLPVRGIRMVIHHILAAEVEVLVVLEQIWLVVLEFKVLFLELLHGMLVEAAVTVF